MLKNISALIQHRHTTKIYSLFLAYNLWFSIAQYQTIIKTIQVPIFFYDAHNMSISTTDNVFVTLQGHRHTMYWLNQHHIMINIDASKFTKGTQDIIISQENLFLPDNVKLIDLIPSHITIQINQNETQ